MKHFLFICSILLFTSFYTQKPSETTVFAPPQYPKDYFSSPVDGRLVLSGNFGELRAGHFHSGIDITPTRSGNEPIFAAANGYVSRIRTQEGGYGQSVYIAHPNGFTTVYGHLNSFSSEILGFLRKKQYETESFEQDLALSPTDIPIKQGQQIATMGNRGHSFGQHLHFEIRETQSEKAVNPLLFGFNVSDNVSPTFNGLKVYLLNDKKEVIGTRYMNMVKKSATEYALAGDTLDVAAPNVAFAVKAADRQGGNSGENGIFTLELLSNNVSKYHFKAEKFGFDETRYINAHIDYYEQYVRRTFYHRAFRLGGDMLSMYDSLQNNGVIAMQQATATDSCCQNITLMASDVAGNKTTFSFVARAKLQLITPVSQPYTYLFPFDKESIIKPNDAAEFYFPKGCFYEDVYARFGVTPTEGGQYSQTYQLHDVGTPVHYDFKIALKPQNLPDSLRSKAFIAYCTREDSHTYTCGGVWDNEGFLTAKNSRFGNYSIEVDQVPPTITTVNFGAKMTRASRLAFRIRDNIEGRPLRYRAEIDGKWIMMELDGKYDLLYCRLEDVPYPSNTEGEHVLKITLTDDRNNTRVFERRFELVDHIERSRPKLKKKKRR